MLREEKRNGTPFGIEADEITARGKLLPDENVIQLVKSWLAENETSFVFDGFPRSVGQADALKSHMMGSAGEVDAVLSLVVGTEELKRRVAARIACTRCGAIFGIGFDLESGSLPCPKCGGAFGRRNDDTVDAFAARLEEYAEKTAPLIHYYETSPIFHSIDGHRPAAEVFHSIQSIIA